MLERLSSQIPKQKYWFSLSRSTNVNVNMSFPNINFEVNLCYASHFDIIETRKVNVGHFDRYYAKNIKFFHMSGGQNSL